jgi:hypothetical protein
MAASTAAAGDGASPAGAAKEEKRAGGPADIAETRALIDGMTRLAAMEGTSCALLTMVIASPRTVTQCGAGGCLSLVARARRDLSEAIEKIPDRTRRRASSESASRATICCYCYTAVPPNGLIIWAAPGSPPPAAAGANLASLSCGMSLDMEPPEALPVAARAEVKFGGTGDADDVQLSHGFVDSFIGSRFLHLREQLATARQRLAALTTSATI